MVQATNWARAFFDYFFNHLYGAFNAEAESVFICQ
jgi:hypothetical protein